jgi:hypothetical protein
MITAPGDYEFREEFEKAFQEEWAARQTDDSRGRVSKFWSRNYGIN